MEGPGAASKRYVPPASDFTCASMRLVCAHGPQPSTASLPVTPPFHTGHMPPCASAALAITPVSAQVRAAAAAAAAGILVVPATAAAAALVSTGMEVSMPAAVVATIAYEVAAVVMVRMPATVVIAILVVWTAAAASLAIMWVRTAAVLRARTAVAVVAAAVIKDAMMGVVGEWW